MTAVPDQRFLAITRTRLAFERTLMAWVRTAVSLITFGFTLDKAQAYLKQREPLSAAAKKLVGLHEFAVIITLVGLGALLPAALQHFQSSKKLHAIATEMPVFTVALGAALVLVALGVLAAVEVLRQ